MSEIYQLKQLQEDQIEEATKVMAQAFHDDPLMIYLFPDPFDRQNNSYFYYKFNILSGLAYGDVNTISENLEGIAVWISPGSLDKKSKNFSKKFRKAVLGWNRVLKENEMLQKRYDSWANIVNQLKTMHSNFPHYMLAMIGVDPIYQRKGYASKLIRAKLKEADNQNFPCFLNTEKEVNVSIYEHFGFELVDKKKVPHSNFHVYAMIRKKKQ